MTDIIKTWKERKGLLNSEPFRALIGVEWEMQAEIDELRAALAQQAEPNAGWVTAADEEMVGAHLGVANLSDSYESAKSKLRQLIDWHVAVATDPAVNGGLSLQPVAQQAEQDDVGINGLTDAETRATMSVIGLSNPAKLTAYERKCFNDWKNP